MKYAEEQLWSPAGEKAREYLKCRGLTERTIKKARLGWNPKDVWRKRTDWGLPVIEAKHTGGFPKRKMIIPAGLTITHFINSEVIRVRVRRLEENADPKYHMLAGGDSRAMILGNGPVFIVFESELDAILIDQEAGDFVNSVALGSAQTRPDKETALILQKAKNLLLALDSDGAGAVECWKWWMRHFKNAQHWPISSKYGKYPSDAWKNGLNLRLWVTAGIVNKGISKSQVLPKKPSKGLQRPTTLRVVIRRVLKTIKRKRLKRKRIQLVLRLWRKWLLRFARALPTSGNRGRREQLSWSLMEDSPGIRPSAWLMKH